ncbi:hypothetical protein AAC387_Pa11g0129 [Persea americana]
MTASPVNSIFKWQAAASPLLVLLDQIPFPKLERTRLQSSCIFSSQFPFLIDFPEDRICSGNSMLLALMSTSVGLSGILKEGELAHLLGPYTAMCISVRTRTYSPGGPPLVLTHRGSADRPNISNSPVFNRVSSQILALMCFSQTIALPF